MESDWSEEFQRECASMHPSDIEASDACTDLCTSQILRELIRRFEHTDGIDFCTPSDLLSLYNHIEHVSGQ